MAYVRKKGKQLVLVHGEREPEGGTVQQRVLFTIYSKAEALAIIGKGDEARPTLFESLLEQQYPDLRFNWSVIRKAIEANLDVLPDSYQYRHERIEKRFREDLGAFARQLFLADPQYLQSAANLIKSQRYELELVSELISWRLRVCSQKESEGNTDDSFFWLFSLQGSEAPPDAEEFVESYYEKADYRRAEAGFRLLTECFDRYAEGYNYLGLIALAERRSDDAVRFFEQTIEVGRTLFPKRISKKRYWSDISTRPYMRGLRNLTLTLNEGGRFDEALDLCKRLDEECGDTITASWFRAAICLNLGRWPEALTYARQIAGIHPEAGFIEAFACDALGDRGLALTSFLHAALNYPRTARMLFGIRQQSPPSYDDVRDHNTGVSLLSALRTYLAKPPRASKRFFKGVLTEPRVEQLLSEVADAVRRWHEDRRGDDRTAFDRMNLMRSRPFAEAEAYRLRDLITDNNRAN